MKKIILIIFVLVLSSCKTTKKTNCDAYGSLPNSKIDTTNFEIINNFKLN